MKPRYITCGIRPPFHRGCKRACGICATAWKYPSGATCKFFQLSYDGDRQRIEHEQEQREYKRVVVIPGELPIDAKVYIIEDPDHLTMLLADEY